MKRSQRLAITIVSAAGVVGAMGAVAIAPTATSLVAAVAPSSDVTIDAPFGTDAQSNTEQTADDITGLGASLTTSETAPQSHTTTGASGSASSSNNADGNDDDNETRGR